MRTIIFILFISLLNLNLAMTQTQTESSFDVAGLNPYKSYTDKEIRMILGQPTRYFVNEDELGEVREYQFGSKENYDMFRYQGGSNVLEFVLETSTYSLFNNQIKIGKPLTIFSTLGSGLLKTQSSKLHYFYPSGKVAEDYLIIKTNADGIIVSIAFLPPE